MKILIDDGMASLSSLSGIGHQGNSLFRYLARSIECDVTYYPALRRLPKVARRLAYMTLENVEALRGRYDLVHYQNYYVPLYTRKSRTVVTIHDMGTFRFPDITPPLYSWYNRHSVRKAVERSDAVIVPSRFSKHEICELLPSAGEERIFICTNGLREPFVKQAGSEADVRSLGLVPFSYFFFAGVLTKRKNLKFLLEAFGIARKKGALSDRTSLVLAGQNAWDTGEIEDLLRQEGVVRLGYVRDEVLPALYRYSNALVFPSFYEGYGIPLIEAMSQGTPIVVSDIPASAELNSAHGNRMHVFSLGDRDALIAILELLARPTGSFPIRVDYGDLSQYHYEKVAARHLDVYRTILAGSLQPSEEAS
jgi:glycosyltransferase involved in cell wall biosynthesis